MNGLLCVVYYGLTVIIYPKPSLAAVGLLQWWWWWWVGRAMMVMKRLSQVLGDSICCLRTNHISAKRANAEGRSYGWEGQKGTINLKCKLWFVAISSVGCVGWYGTVQCVIWILYTRDTRERKMQSNVVQALHPALIIGLWKLCMCIAMLLLLPFFPL